MACLEIALGSDPKTILMGFPENVLPTAVSLQFASLYRQRAAPETVTGPPAWGFLFGIDEIEARRRMVGTGVV